MVTATRRLRFSRMDSARFAVLVVIAVGCATTHASRVEIPTSARFAMKGDSDRILVGGFVAGVVSDRGVRIDVNDETARFLRGALRKALLEVIDAEPLRLQAESQHKAVRLDSSPRIGSASAVDPCDAVFTNAGFWKRIGEEYGYPLILTGTVTFDSVGPLYEERTVGVRTIRIWHPGFRLGGTLVLISGTTGEIVDSLTLRPLTEHASSGRESALSVYFTLMDRAMPSVLRLLGQQTTSERLLIR